jgi:hypothetical protein
MPNLTFSDRRQLESLFNMGGGYVLDFSDGSFASFFRQDIGVDINDKKYLFNGKSKANRLRAFWEIEPPGVVAVAIDGLLKVWRAQNPVAHEAHLESLFEECLLIVDKLKAIKSRDLDPQAFLEEKIDEVSFDGLCLDIKLLPALKIRLAEMRKCESANLPLAMIILCGSILEGILLSAAMNNPAMFNAAKSAPKDKGAVRPFKDWTLASLIDVACELGLIREDAKKLSHFLREFRNYVHVREQADSGFNPDMLTAKICSQLLRLFIAGLKQSKEAGHLANL